MAHPKLNFQLMMDLIDQTFATRKDPGQIQVTNEQREKLQALHPSTLSELADNKGPLIWILLIPTTKKVMQDFLQGNISEKQILENTKLGDTYDCIYLCSATTLPQMRGKGETKKLCITAIDQIQKDHAITHLFVWPFTQEGELLAKVVAQECKMELLIKG